MQRQVEKCEDGFIDFLGIDIRGSTNSSRFELLSGIFGLGLKENLLLPSEHTRRVMIQNCGWRGPRDRILW